MGFVSEIEAQLRANNSDFKAKFEDANATVQKFGQKFNSVGSAIGGMLGPIGQFAGKFGIVGAAITAAVGGLVAFHEHLKEAKYGVDENTDAAKRLHSGFGAIGETVKEMGRGLLDAGVALTGTLARAGEWLVKQTEIGKKGLEQVAIEEAIARQTEETLARLEKQKIIAEEVNRIRAQIGEIEKKAAEEAARQLDIKDQIFKAEVRLAHARDAEVAAGSDSVALAKAQLVTAQARADVEKLRGEQTKKAAEDEKKNIEVRNKAEAERLALVEKLQKLEFDRLGIYQQIDALVAKEAKLQADIEKAKKAGRDTIGLQIQLIETQNSLLKIGHDLSEKGLPVENARLQLLLKQEEAINRQLARKKELVAAEDESARVTAGHNRLAQAQGKGNEVVEAELTRQTREAHTAAKAAEKRGDTAAFDREMARVEELTRRVNDLKESSGNSLRIGLASAVNSSLNLERRAQIQGADDAVLEELARRLREEILQVDSGPMSAAEMASGGFGRKLEKVPLTFELGAIEQELALRASLRSDAKYGGYDLALRNFRGDPLAFNGVFQQVVKDGGETRDLLKSVDRRLSAIGRRFGVKVDGPR